IGRTATAGALSVAVRRDGAVPRGVRGRALRVVGEVELRAIRGGAASGPGAAFAGADVGRQALEVGRVAAAVADTVAPTRRGTVPRGRGELQRVARDVVAVAVRDRRGGVGVGVNQHFDERDTRKGERGAAVHL